MGEYGISFAPGKDPSSLIRRIKIIQKRIGEGVTKGAQKGAMEMAQDAQEILTSKIIYPEKSTGRTAASIVADTHLAGKGIENTFFVFTNDTAPWAIFVEKGHGSFEGHHFMEDAFNLQKTKLIENVKTEIIKSISGLKI